MRIVAGIDGGGTHTRVLLVREDGVTLGYGEAGPSNIHHVGAACAQTNIQYAFKAAWKSAKEKPRRCDAAFLGMAGISNDAERAIIRRIANKLNLAPAKKIGVDHDIRIALAGGLAGREGIALIVGTGSSCYGRRDDGRECKVGGWGYLLDDVGGGVFLGLEALRAYVRVCDGRDKPGELFKRVKNALGQNDPRDLVRRVYRSQGKSDSLTLAEIAKLAPMVISAAQKGDGLAREIVLRGVSGLAEMVWTAARKLEFRGRVNVALCGGLAEASDFYSAKISAEIKRCDKHCEIVRAKFTPVVGAALLALRRIEVRRDAITASKIQRE